MNGSLVSRGLLRHSQYKPIILPLEQEVTVVLECRRNKGTIDTIVMAAWGIFLRHHRPDSIMMIVMFVTLRMDDMKAGDLCRRARLRPCRRGDTCIREASSIQEVGVSEILRPCEKTA